MNCLLLIFWIHYFSKREQSHKFTRFRKLLCANFLPESCLNDLHSACAQKTLLSIVEFQRISPGGGRILWFFCVSQYNLDEFLIVWFITGSELPPVMIFPFPRFPSDFWFCFKCYQIQRIANPWLEFAARLSGRALCVQFLDGTGHCQKLQAWNQPGQFLPLRNLSAGSVPCPDVWHGSGNTGG